MHYHQVSNSQSDENQIGSQRGPDHNIITTPSVHFPAPVSSTEIPIRNLSSNALEKNRPKKLKNRKKKQKKV